jgi:putative membrane protein
MGVGTSQRGAAIGLREASVRPDLMARIGRRGCTFQPRRTSVRTTTIGLLTALSLTALAGCSMPQQGTMGAGPAGAAAAGARLSAADVAFITAAAGGGMYEVEAGRLGAARAANAEVKSFAQMLVGHHTQSNNELMALARAKGLAPSTALPADLRAKANQLAGLSGDAFDREFIRNAGVQDHQTQIAQFEQASRTVADADLKAWVVKTLPVLRQHLQAAQQISGRMAG